MHHYFEAITNRSGDSLIGYYGRVIDPATNNVVTIAADDNGTPISVVSGIVNMAATDANGNLDFYVAPGTYHLDIYAPNATSLILRIKNVAMNSTKGDTGAQGQPGDTGASDSAFLTLAALKSASPAAYPSPRLAAPSGSDGGVMNGLFIYQTGNFSGRADVVQVNGIPLTTGALVRPPAASSTYQRANGGARSLQSKADDTLNVRDFKGQSDALFDGTFRTLSASGYASLGAAQADFPFITALSQGYDWAVFQKALNASLALNGFTLEFQGTAVLREPLTWRPATSGGTFYPAPRILGRGEFQSQLVHDFNGSLLNIGTETLLKFVKGGFVSGIGISKGGNSTGGQTGIYLHGAYNFDLSDVSIFGLSGTGIRIPALNGDGDASNTVQFHRVRVDSCTGWGVDIGDPGHNENSFITMDGLFVQNCGTVAANSIPASGGMKWVGQVLSMKNCAFTINNECALFIPGQSGLGNNASISDTAFENNHKRHFFCRGIAGLRWRNNQMYSNDSDMASVGFEIEAGSFAAKNIDVEGTRIRVTAGNNPYIAFKTTGANLDRNSVNIKSNDIANFGFVGQTFFEGVPSKQIAKDCDLIVADDSTIALRPLQGRGNTIPIRRAAPRNDTAGATARITGAEWAPCTVRFPGITATNAGLSAGSAYFVYVWEPTANTVALFLSNTVGPVQDVEAGSGLTASGYMVASDDASKLYVGKVLTDGAAKFVTGGTGWLNPTLVSGSQTGVPAYVWTDSTGKLRIKTSTPLNDTDGAIVGA